MRVTSRALSLSVLLVLTLALPAWGVDGPIEFGLTVKSDGAETTLSLDGAEPFHRTGNVVLDDRLIDLPGSSLRVALWSELQPEGGSAPYYGISLDGREMATIRRTSYRMNLRYGEFDPLQSALSVDASLVAGESAGLYYVQFVTQPLEEYRAAIRELGGTVHQFVANHAHYVKMSPQVREAVEALPFVRWTGPVHPAFKLEEQIRHQIVSEVKVEPRRYSIMLHERGEKAQSRVIEQVVAAGGLLHGSTPLGFRIEATLSLAQVEQIAALDDVMFIDRKGPLETDMDIVREIGGANHVETVAGFTGQGVRAEVADSEIDEDHPEWSAPPIIHVAGASVDHGTSVYGILFAQGTNPQARGLIPDGVGIFAYSTGLLGGGPTRYTHTAELVDPAGPYRAVLQTNSTGDPRTFFYTTISAEMDDILFINDISITQSQSNAGNQDSRPQAWAKNIISGGAVDHFNTLTRDDDSWSSGSGSIGPAEDGRIKPDLCFFYDLTFAPSNGGGYTEFGGTSGATPSIAGYLGLFYQMWSEQVFGNEVSNPGGTVFENRPHMTTAKAAMINTATQYPFTGTTHDMTRVHQGWGMPSAQYLYDMRDKIGFIDETELLQNLDSVEFVVFIEEGEPELRATMTYADPMGTPGAAVNRINDLTLKVTSPSAEIYWGNNGLLEGNYSTPGGDPNTIDTVENVFVQNPEPGVWAVEVIASEINEDSHVETPEIDADFALVVSGGALTNCTSQGRIQLDRSVYHCSSDARIRVVDCDLNTSDTVIDTVTVTINSTSEPGGETVVLTETAETTADFRATIPLSLAGGAGELQVADGDVVTATYIDADDGAGGTNVTVQDTATLDCRAPVISDVQSGGVTGQAATITFNTDEPGDSTVHYGLAPPGNLTQYDSELVTAHDQRLTDLDECSIYYYWVASADSLGNAASDDNLGSFYSFETGKKTEPDFPSTDTPIPISDNTTHTSTISVTDDKQVLDIKVKINITHTYTGDLDITLISPTGTRVLLVADRGSSGDNFVDTVFDDSATTPISGGSAPFTGSYQPEQPLAGATGISSSGDWTLEVVDDAGSDTGTLNDWTLTLTYPAQACGPSATYGQHFLEADVCATGAGNDNGFWDSGEQIQFSLSVVNDGTDPLTGVTAVVTALTPGVLMIDDTAAYGDITEGMSALSAAPHYSAKLPAGLTCGGDIAFEVTISANEGGWSRSFTQVGGEVIPGGDAVAYFEDFEAAGIPPEWTIVDINSDGNTWFADNASDPSGCANTDPNPPLAGNWAAVDSDCTGSGVAMDEELISPVYDLTGIGTVNLEFDHWFNWLGPEKADVDVRSTLTGGLWVNMAQWVADTANPEHAMLDISAQAANVSDLQIRWHYYDADYEWYWYVDNVALTYPTDAECNIPECLAGAAGPPPIPDGGAGSVPMLGDLLAVDGSRISISWDDQCGPASTKILYGSLDQVASHSVTGAECAIGNPQVWDPVPAGDLWFVLVSDDGTGLESSWGQATSGERAGLSSSGTCGSTAKEISGACP